MQHSPQVTSAVDAVRCLYLARVAEQEGHPDAAGCWQQMADGWLAGNKFNNGTPEKCNANCVNVNPQSNTRTR